MKAAEFEKQYGYSMLDVDKFRALFQQRRLKKERIWRMLDSYDTGEFWDTIRSRLPSHQLIPDTNHVFYVKDNIVNSTYAAPYIADVLPTDPNDQDLSREINKFIEYEYNRQEVGDKQLSLGTRTALLNCSFLQFAWNKDSEIKVGENVNKGEIEIITRDPMEVLLDPNFKDFQEGRAVFILGEDSYDSIVANYPSAKEDIDEIFKSKTDGSINVTNNASPYEMGKSYNNKDVVRTNEGMLPVYNCFYKVLDDNNKIRIDQIIYTTDNIVLYAKKGIKPNYFPLVALYATPPEKDPYGIGVVQRIVKNAMAINVLDSISVTHVYASQRTPVVLDLRSGLSAARVAAEINDPDRVFPINDGDPSKVIHRLDYPDLPNNLEYIKSSLEAAIEKITGVDVKYTGRDTASVTTTGGMERLQSRVTMTDNTRINLIEKYARDFTKMLLDFYVHFGGERHFATNKEQSKQEQEALSVDFNKLKENKHERHQFAFHIEASPLLPKNRARLAEAANMIMEMQLQYQGQIELMTGEEWLFYQDFPQKDMMLDRMKLDRLRDDFEEITNELSSFSAMTEQGMRPEAAVQQLADERKAKRDPSVRRKQLQNS